MKKNIFPYYNSICILAVCSLLLPLLVASLRERAFAGADSLSAALLCCSAVLLLLPVSEERATGPFWTALAATAVCVGFAAAGLPFRVWPLSLLAILVVSLGCRTAQRYSQLWPLFRPSKVWTHVEYHARSAYALVLCLLVAGFPSAGAPVVLSWLYAVPCVALTALLVARVLTGRTFFLPHKKELAIKEMIKGNLRNTPAQTGDRTEEMGRMQRLYDRIVTLMEEKRPFLDPEFSLADLSGAVFSNRGYLSRTINILSGQNFRQFVNGYRIRYGVELIRKDPSLRVSDVAMMSGFHTTVTFNMAFKLYMGETPSQYQERQRLERLSSPDR